MTLINLEQMSKVELIRELRKLQTAEARFISNASEPDPKRLIHDLHVHQVQLEMQNRELREAQELLEESRSRYADLYDFAPVGYCTFDSEGRIREINLTGAAMLGAPREAILDRPFTSVVSIKETHAFRAHLRECAQRNARVTTELTLSAKGHAPTAVQLVTFSTGSGETPGDGFRTALVDISRLKELETRLRFLAQAGETLASSLDYPTTLAAVVRFAVPLFADLCFVDVLDEDGRVQRLEVVFADASNQSEISGRVGKLTPRPAWRTPQDDVIASGESMLLEEVPKSVMDGIVNNGQHTALMPAIGVKSMMIVPLRARDRVLGALTLVAAQSGRRYTAADRLFAEDIGRRAAVAIDNARLHEQAQRAIRTRDALLALVSHDLRNPLSVILHRTALLLKLPPADDRRSKVRESIESIQRSAERMNRLVGDLLDVASIEAGHLSVDKHREPNRPLIGAALEALQDMATEKSQTLESDLRDVDGRDASCDRERILQVFTNLIGNAIKFTPEGGTITVRAESLGDEIKYSVVDTGPGIPPEQLPHIFDRFWQATKTGHLGTGLGLSIVRGIVEAHGGRVWAESQMGVGSRFCFTLPVANRPVAAEPPASDRPDRPEKTDRTSRASSPGRVVLLVDDDTDGRLAVRETLEEEGYQVITTSNGAEALAYLRAAPTRPFVLILDLNMPVMDGRSFLSERDQDPDLRAIPVIVVSGDGSVRMATSTNVEYVQKPVRIDSLLEAIQHFAH